MAGFIIKQRNVDKNVYQKNIINTLVENISNEFNFIQSFKVYNVKLLNKEMNYELYIKVTLNVNESDYTMYLLEGNESLNEIIQKLSNVDLPLLIEIN